MFDSVPYRETADAVERVEDWSDVRSPARARRRRAKYQQRIRIIAKPAAFQYAGVLYIHPELAKELRRQTVPA